MTNFHPQMTLPQVVAIDGQLFYVTPNQSFLDPASANRSPFSLQAAHYQAAQQQMQQTQVGAQPQGAHLQQQQQLHQQQLQLQQVAQQHLQQLQLPAPQPEPEVDLSIDNDFDFSTSSHQQLEQQQTLQIRQTPPVAKTNDRVKTKVKNIRGGTYISHYIDSQIIIETPEPLRVKTKKKKKKLLAPNQNSANIQVDFAQQQQQQQQQVVLSHQQQRLDISQPIISSPVVGPSPSSSAGQLVIQDITEESMMTSPTTNAVAVNTIDSDILKVREKMKSWSVADVVNFIECHDAISAYSAKFAEDEIDGTALLYMIDRNLNIQVLSTMFKYGPAMKIEATLSHYKLKE